MLALDPVISQHWRDRAGTRPLKLLHSRKRRRKGVGQSGGRVEKRGRKALKGKGRQKRVERQEGAWKSRKTDHILEVEEGVEKSSGEDRRRRRYRLPWSAKEEVG